MVLLACLLLLVVGRGCLLYQLSVGVEGRLLRPDTCCISLSVRATVSFNGVLFHGVARWMSY